MSILVSQHGSGEFSVRIVDRDMEKWTDDERALIKACARLQTNESDLIHKLVHNHCAAVGVPCTLSIEEPTDKRASVLATLEAVPFVFRKLFEQRDEEAIRDAMFRLAFDELDRLATRRDAIK